MPPIIWMGDFGWRCTQLKVEHLQSRRAPHGPSDLFAETYNRDDAAILKTRLSESADFEAS